EGETSCSNIPYEPSLLDNKLPIEKPSLWDDFLPTEDQIPNNIYQEFIEIIMEYQLSNSCGDRIIKLINNSQNSTDKNLLPKSIKEGRKFLDVNEFPYMKFKIVPITNFQDIDYNFHYQPIIHGIKMYMKLHQESFTDIELAELQAYITEFYQEFVTIFYDYLSSHCRIPKLHVLHYHELNVSKIESKVSQIKQDDDIHRLYKEGFDNLCAGFNEFLVENNITYDNEFGYFKIYSSVA
ncbi:10042_t:CDS:2, partial [Funneliformis geosporum]